MIPFNSLEMTKLQKLRTNSGGEEWNEHVGSYKGQRGDSYGDKTVLYFECIDTNTAYDTVLQF